ncbi:MAG: FMN-binding protein [Treponema sp.]|nr:FMN-binding protein [Treponema sp.]
MKKAFLLGLGVIVLFAFAPVAFAQTVLKDGTYRLEEKNYDHGYRVVFEIIVKKGKITKVNYDNVNDKGGSKTKDNAYQASMKKVNGLGPKEFIPRLAKNFQKVQDPAKIDIITGASHSSESFKAYAEKLVEAAQNGDTTPIIIENEVSG